MLGMSTSVLETEPVAVQVTVTNKKLMVDLADGRSIAVPLAWYPRLMYGSPKERQNWQLLGDGYAIEWPDLLTSMLALKGHWLADAAAKAKSRLSVGWLLVRNHQQFDLLRRD
jgi:hypothetical protein